MKDVLLDDENYKILFEKAKNECFYIRVILKEINHTILFEQLCFSEEAELKHHHVKYPINEILV